MLSEISEKKIAWSRVHDLPITNSHAVSGKFRKKSKFSEHHLPLHHSNDPPMSFAIGELSAVSL